MMSTNNTNTASKRRPRRKSQKTEKAAPAKAVIRQVNPVKRPQRANFANRKLESIPNVNYEEMRKWVENHYSLKECFLIPREQRSYVQPHKWDFSSEIINEFCEGDISRVAVKCRPSVNHFLSLGKPVTTAKTVTWDDRQEDESEYPSFHSDAIGSGISFDENIRTTDGALKLKAGLVDARTNYRYLDSGDLKLGCKMYSGALPDWDGKIQYRFHNPDNAPAGCAVTIVILREEFNGQIIAEDVSGGPFVTIPADGTLDGITSVAAPALYADIKAFGFVFNIVNTDVIGRMPSGFTARIGFPDNVLIAQPFVWRDFDVWTIINDKTGALKSQYESSNFHCFTALHVTIANTQAEIYKGGSVNAAQLSGLSDDKLPHTFNGLDSWLGNRTYDTNKEKSLTNGLHWNYRWEKVQDTFFITRDEEESEGIKRPSMVATLMAPSVTVNANDRKFSLRLHGAVMIEYITEVRDAPVFLAPADTINLLARYCAVRAEMPCLMENPSHWQTLKSNVTKVMKHPVTKTIMKEAAMAGLKLLLV